MKPIAPAAILLALTLALATATAFAQPAPAAPAEITIKGKVDAVTVYRGQALVTRTVELPAGAAAGEIVITDLPEHLVPSSIFAEAAADGIEVRSVRYRERPVAQDGRADVSKLDTQLQDLADKLAAVDKQSQLLQEQRAYLDKLSNFAAPTATVEMTKGVLDAKQITDLTKFQFDQRKQIADQELTLQKDRRKVSEEIAVLQRTRNDVTGKSSKTSREAIVFVNRKAGGTLRLRYLVEAASWSPSYNIRADAARKNASIEYQASIQQMSGEDWNDVAMTLSTATPNLVAAAPQLEPLNIALVSRSINDPTRDLAAQVDYSQGKAQLFQAQQKAEVVRNNLGNSVNITNSAIPGPAGGPAFANPGGFNFNGDNDRDLNKVAEQLQVLELLAGDDKSSPARRAIANTEGIVVTYDMRARTSLPSRSDNQLIQIDSLTMKSDFYKVAIPVLTTYVYDEAALVNTSKIVMLAGTAASYVGGQFVGNGNLPTVAVGQPFTVGFGIDSSLKASRERTEKTEQTQTGNKVVNYTFKIAIENFGSTAATVRVLDRLPNAKENEVRVDFVDAANAPLSKDAKYQQVDRKKGILRWDIEVPPQKNGVEAFALTYKMKMEYDRNLAISAGAVLRREELEKLMEKK